jgi:hypothetical protein
MRKLFAIAALLTLSGCAHVRYVTVGCISRDQLAERKSAEPPHVSDKLTGKADEDVKVIAGSAIRLRAWGEGNLAILEGCVG